MLPQPTTVFLPISDLENYKNEEKYFCSAVVFSPDTENQHFNGCPPYLSIDDVEGIEQTLYFEIPSIVAYYAKTHTGYTMAGMERRVKEGRRLLAEDIKSLLGIE